MRTIRGSWPFLLCVGVVLASGTAGSVDTSFGTNGLVLVDSGGGAMLAVAAQADGKIVTAGHDFDSGVVIEGRDAAQWRVRRHNGDGTIDTSFGGDGGVELFGQYWISDAARDVAIDGNGRLLVAGKAVIQVTSGNGRKQTTSNQQVAMLVRLNADGSRDTGFGDNGEAALDLAGTIEALAVQPDGKIVVAGQAVVSASGGGKKKKGGGGGQSASVLFVARFASDGTLDSGFGADGVTIREINVSTTIGDEWVSAGQIALQSDGRILVGARRSNGENWILLRFGADGSVDSDFGEVLESGDSLGGFTIDGSDRIVAAGTRNDSGSFDTLVVRYTAGGARDTTFGSGGEALAGISDANGAHGVALDASGRYVVGISVQPASAPLATGAVRFLASGSLDTNFGSGGISALISLASEDLAAADVALDANGDIVNGGWTNQQPIDWFLARICG